MSLYLDENVDRDEPTEIEFIGYPKDWNIFLCDVSRYTLRVVLVKGVKDESIAL